MTRVEGSGRMKVEERVLALIEEMMEVVPQGTALGLCDLMSAMLSGYFIESGGAVMPAVEAFLRTEIEDEEERARRSRRAAKALTYGSYNMGELMAKLEQIVEEEGLWQVIRAGGYRVVAVDGTAYRRVAVKKQKSKAYFSESNRALPATPIGLIARVGEVNGQRVALLKKAIVSDVTTTDMKADKQALYRQVALCQTSDELSVFDAGFSLAEALEAGIEQCVIRIAKNATFGQTAGKIPEPSSGQGRPPTRHQAEIVRPLARKHGDKTIPATPADKICTITDESDQTITVHIWQKLYFLERHLDKMPEDKKEQLRQTPLQVMAFYHPAYEKPLLLGTPLLTLTPTAAYQAHHHRWPIEGLPQTGKYILSGGGGTHYVHHLTAMARLPTLSLIFGSLLKYVAATTPPIRTGFWDRVLKPTYGRLLRLLKKLGSPYPPNFSKRPLSLLIYLAVMRPSA